MLFVSIQDALKEVENVEQKLKQLSQLKQDLVEYFCEDENKFKLEDLLGIFKTFCNHLDKAKEVCYIAVNNAYYYKPITNPGL